MDKPDVSVVIPVYNSISYLPELMRSLRHQTLKNIELIFVDDCSDDDSVVYLNKVAEYDSRIVVIEPGVKLGAGAARNYAFDYVRGRYLCFVDSDDFLELDALAQLVRIADDNDVDVVIFGIDQYREVDGVFMDMPWAVVEGRVPEGQVFSPADVENFYKYMVGFTVNKLYRSDYFLNLGVTFPDVGAHEDMPFTYAAVSVTQRAYYHKPVLYHYRRQREGSRSDDTEDQFVFMLEALEVLKKELERLGVWEQNERNYANYVLHMVEWKFSSTHGLVRQRFDEVFRNEWANRLGILGYPDDYFYIDSERELLNRIMSKPYVVQLEEEISRKDVRIRKLEKDNAKLRKKLKEASSDFARLRKIRKKIKL